MITRKTKSQCNKIGQAGVAGRVGIFWHREGKLLVANVPLEDGLSNAVSVNGPFDHVTTWPRFQRQFPTLAAVEYEDVPRGRVLFLKRGRRFVVYLDKALMNEAVRQAIRKEFRLPAGTTRFAGDPHYTTDAREIGLMFDS